MIKNPPAMQETWVRSLGWEDSLEKGMAVHSSILAWRIPWIEDPGRLQSLWSQSQTQLSNFHSLTFSIYLRTAMSSFIFYIETLTHFEPTFF